MAEPDAKVALIFLPFYPIKAGTVCVLHHCQSHFPSSIPDPVNVKFMVCTRPTQTINLQGSIMFKYSEPSLIRISLTQNPTNPNPHIDNIHSYFDVH